VKANSEWRRVGASTVAVNPQNPRPLLLGHRGVRPLPFLGLRWRRSVLPVENTIDAFDYAMAHGCDGFEFDLRYTRDRRSLLHHDPDVKGRTVAVTEHAALDRRMGHKLASLEDTLLRFASTAWLDIELKIAGEEESLVAALRNCPPQRGFVVSSFLPDVLLRLHEIDPALPLGYICEHEGDARLWSGLPTKFFTPHHSLVSEWLVEEAHRRKMQLITWTVNRREDMLRLASWGVDGLISDDPKLLSQTFPRPMSSAAGA
jgi:glycerophosphoryl diester phosphodiesterase